MNYQLTFRYPRSSKEGLHSWESQHNENGVNQPFWGGSPFFPFWLFPRVRFFWDGLRYKRIESKRNPEGSWKQPNEGKRRGLAEVIAGETFRSRKRGSVLGRNLNEQREDKKARI